jgi:hypothetical protein
MKAEEIEQRIKSEYKKHKKLDWAKIVAQKIYSSFNYCIKENYTIGRNMSHEAEKTLRDQNNELWKLEKFLSERNGYLLDENKKLEEALKYLLEGINGLPALTAIEGALTKHCNKAKEALKFHK